jgi:protease IV
MLGLSTEAFRQGRNADLFSSSQKWNDRQRRMIRSWMQQTYDQFTQRVMTTRQGKISDVDKVARGRIFLAQQAKDLGMVDELGGCDAAIAYAADQAGLDKGTYDIRMIPPARTLADLFGGGRWDEDAATPLRPNISIGPESALQLLPPSARQTLTGQLQLMQLLEKRPVVLLAPYVVTVK